MKANPRSVIVAAALALCPLTYAEETMNLLENAEAVSGFNIYPAPAAETAKDVPNLSKPGAFAIQVTVTPECVVGEKTGVNLVNKTIVPVAQGERIRCSFRAKGTGDQTATVVLYYLDQNKQQITGVWPKFPTGLQLSSDWQDYEVEYTIQADNEDPSIKAAVDEKAGGIVNFLSCAVLVEGDGTAELADLKLEKNE